MTKKDIKVLLVDDEASLVEAMRRILVLEGYEVRTAVSGKEAIKACQGESFDIVFLDVNMPDLNGLETYKRLREIVPGIPVVMITGYGRSLKPLIEEAIQIGVKGCIDKPFKIGQVIESIKTYVPRGA